MLKIKYAGPRPVISQHGISYKNGKEDKYIYLQAALEILHDIDHNYEDTKLYSSYISMKKLTESQIHKILQKYDVHLESDVVRAEQEYESKILQEIIDIQNLTNISQIEKDVWCENIKLMKDYRIQRAINKIYYFHCIKDISKIIIKQRIKEIDTPFSEIFLHILHSMQGEVENSKFSNSTKLEELTNKNNSMILKLRITI